MDDLIAWLRAQLDDDEETARDAGRRWKRDLISCVVDATDGGLIVYGEGTPTAEQAEHIARHDPARVLAEVDAKRRILDEHKHYQNPYSPEEIACGVCHADRHETYYGVNNWCPTVRLLALPYADRDGYQERWRPQD